MDNTSNLKRKDTTKGPPLRILSLDGGGVRGYSMLILLQELMHRTYVEVEGKAPRRDQIPKPADHFDLIVGTGTGGLIALMLGRLRLDLETCKEVYVRLTRTVFETDKTIAGIPYRSTLFKASRLEEAIKQCVRQYTVLVKEGNDGVESQDAALLSPLNPLNRPLSGNVARHGSNASVASFSARSPSTYQNPPQYLGRGGNPNAFLYDNRENRTKTAVTAVYRGSSKGTPPAFLRSYDSRKEPSPEYNCKIWEAGRATSAIGLAFKPIQVGQSVFHDEGAGQFNPAPYVLDEACVNEWPGREVGVFVSVGTGRRPTGSDHDQHLWYEGFMGEFAEARRRLISKIEGCEDTHQYMKREGLAKRGVNIENYYRLNVEIGVGEFGMNEWNRLADISTNTRRYLGKSDVQRMTQESAVKLAKILRAKQRFEREASGDFSGAANPHGRRHEYKDLADVPEAYPTAVELPAEIPPSQAHYSPPPRPSYESGRNDNLAVPDSLQLGSPRSSGENVSYRPSPRTSADQLSNPDRLVVNNPTPSQYRTAGGADKIAIVASDGYPRPPVDPRISLQSRRVEPPPLPPKTPIQFNESDIHPALRGQNGITGPGYGRPHLPYPDDDGPPPVANMARKPAFNGR